MIQVTDLNQQGQGIARLEGQVVFVDGAVPGDSIRVDQLEQHASYAVARQAELIVPSPDRIEPFCAVFDRCGGCAMQALNYPAQLSLKRRHVVELMQRIGRLPEAEQLVLPTLGMDDPYAYRCKIQFPIRGTKDEPLIGFYERKSHAVVDASRCDVGHPAGDLIREVVRRYIQRFGVEPYRESDHRGTLRHLVVRIGYQTGQVMVILVSRKASLPGIEWLKGELEKQLSSACWKGQTASFFELKSLVLNLQPDKTNVILGSHNQTLHGQAWIEDRLMGLTFRISPQSFFQVNPKQTEKLYQAAIDFADIKAGEHVLDLYCGTGTIALALARASQRSAERAAKVVGVESFAPAIADAWVNAELNGLLDVEFVVAKAEDWLPKAINRGQIQPVAAVIDPPRKGCEKPLLDALNQVGLKRLIYVSCNPATLARDLAVLQESYAVSSILPVDLFPWTESVECVCLLKSKNKTS